MKTILLDTSIDYTSWDINEAGSIEMTEDEERHADEVNIAFQMGADWERKQSKARIEKLEARVLLLEGYLNGALNVIEGFVACDTKEARKALEGKDD